MVRGRTPDLCWRLMDAQHWASPRLARRQRIFLVADFGGRRSHEILFKPRTMQSLPALGGDRGLPAACGDRGSFIEAGRRVPITQPFQCFRMRASAKERTETAFRNSFGLPTDPFPTLLAGGISPFAFWYFDFEAYGRDMRINEGGHFAPTGYLTRSGDFKEVYHGIEDIPAEHRIFAYPKLNIREQMAAYKEVIDRSSLEGERLHPRKEHDDR